MTPETKQAIRLALDDMIYMADNLECLSEFRGGKAICPTEKSNDLCGNDKCDQCGCIVLKLRRARIALRSFR